MIISFNLDISHEVYGQTKGKLKLFIWEIKLKNKFKSFYLYEGDKGDKGQTGSTGPTGPIGTTGPTGPTG